MLSGRPGEHCGIPPVVGQRWVSSPPIGRVWSGGLVLGGLVNETITQDGKSVAVGPHFADV